jgi:hypothetical protein
VGCDPFNDQLFDGKDGIARLRSDFDVFQSQVSEDGAVDFEFNGEVLRVCDLLGNEMSQPEKDGLVKYDR